MSEDTRPAEETEYAIGWDKRTVEEALDEVARECQVRGRCFPRWVGEGRMSRSDAKDRLQRLCKAKELLERLQGIDGAETTPGAF
jgi:hypothetical protein